MDALPADCRAVSAGRTHAGEYLHERAERSRDGLRRAVPADCVAVLLLGFLQAGFRRRAARCGADERIHGCDVHGFDSARRAGHRPFQGAGRDGRVVRMADLNETFGYQIFTGARHPSRNKVLQIAFAMALTLKETNRALTAAGVSVLNCKDRRDAIIIFCIDRGCSLQKVNEELYRFGEETVS